MHACVHCKIRRSFNYDSLSLYFGFSMLTIENEENLVGSLIQRDFGKEINHLKKMFELFIKSYNFICTHEDDLLSKEDYAKWSIFLLFIRNLRILRSAHHSMLNGYYEVSIAIQRIAFENHLLMYFFMHRPEEAKEWWLGKKYGLRRLKKEARKTLSYDEVYGELSQFVHANVETTRFFWKPKDEETTIWTTDFVPIDFHRALIGLSTFGMATLSIIIPTIFGTNFQEEPLLKEIQELNTLSKQTLKDAFEKLKKHSKRTM